MRDEIDGRIWTAHHEEFSASVDAAIAELGAKVRRLLALRNGVANQLLSFAAAFTITALTFTTSVS